MDIESEHSTRKRCASPQLSHLFGWLLLVTAVLIIPQVAFAQQSWQATAGGQSHDKAKQVLAFLPNEVWIHAGDSVTWKFNADEIHTVTFLTPGQPRPPFFVGCPGVSPDGSPFDDSACVTSAPSVTGQTFTVNFPTAGNFKLACLVHPNMTGVVHVLDPSEPLPHSEDFYEHRAADERNDLLADIDHPRTDPDLVTAKRHGVTAGIGETAATPGGEKGISVVRFMAPTKTVHVGGSVEWGNMDPALPHTITFGPAPDPPDPVPPSPNVTVDTDGARHATISSPTDNVHSGFIVAAPQEQTGLPQAPIGVTRFRVTFTKAGVFSYRCVLHDNLGMIGTVIVLP